MEPDGLQTFIDDVGRVVTSTDDEHEITGSIHIAWPSQGIRLAAA
jgi:hypothetical protein